MGFLLMFVSSTADAATFRVTLAEAEKILAARNPNLAAARASVEGAQAERTIAAQFPNPEFAFQQDHIPIGSGNQYGGSSSQALTGSRFLLDNAAGASLSWKIEIGKRGPRQESAGYLIVAARETASDTLRKKRSDLQASFTDALRSEEELKLAREILTSQEETLRINEAKVRAGAIPEADVIKLRLEMRNYQTDILQMEFAVRKARSDLHELLGLGRNDEVEPVGQLLDERLMTAQPPPLAKLLERAYELRPDVALLRAQGAKAAADIRVAESQKIPDITVNVGYQYDAPNSYMTYGFSLPIPVAYRYRGEEMRAHAESRRVAAEYVAARLRIAGEVREALWKFETARALVQRYRGGYLDQAAESRLIASRAYERRATSMLELLEAQRTYVAVRREWIRNVADLRGSAAILNSAVGEVVIP
jgi:cobalt-zinc-cadmium efflux system outer membrane protein